MVQGNEPNDGGEAFGFSPEGGDKEEKYNTRYLVSNMTKDRRKTMMFVIGGVIAAGLGLALLISMMPDAKAPAAPKPAVAEARAAAPEAKKADPPSEEKNAEAKEVGEKAADKAEANAK